MWSGYVNLLERVIETLESRVVGKIMSGKIQKIDLIKNMAVFQDFQWVSSVRDRDNKIAEFKKINILYGRNYSGKNNSFTNF